MNPFAWSFRRAFGVAAAIIAVFLAFAFYAQFYMNLEPCPLCILQRVAFIVLLVFCVLAAIHGPMATGRKIYGILAFLAAGTGAAIAGRHVWLQHLPADQVPDCGPGLEYMLEAFPLSKTFTMLFSGSGECAKVDWQFIGLSMSEWSLLWFGVFTLGALYFGFRRYLN